MGETAVVTNLQKFSVHDGPGIRSILFLKGCPLHCQWCANPENIGPAPELMVYGAKCIGCGRCVDQCSRGAIAADGTGRPPDKGLCVDCGACAAVCPSGARVIKGARTTAEEARRAVDRDVPFYKNSGGGITFSGGEPLLHPDFIVEIARAYRAEGLNTAVETCGCVPWQTFEQVLPWIDLFLFDLKMMDSEKHCRYCGRGNEQILANLSRLCGQAWIIVRMPIIPGVNDSEADLRQAGAYLARYGDEIEAVHCLPYHNMGLSKYEALGRAYALQETALPNAEDMARVKELLEGYGLRVQIGG